METGYKSYRAKVFENFPRTNLPDHFSSYSEFENYVNLLTLIQTDSDRQCEEDLVGIDAAASILRHGGGAGVRSSRCARMKTVSIAALIRGDGGEAVAAARAQS